MTTMGAIVTVLVLVPPSPAPAIDPQEPTLVDRQVIATVLDDLASYRGKDSPIDGVFSPDPLRLDPAPRRFPAEADDLLRRNRPDKWRSLADRDGTALHQAAEDLVRRMAEATGRFAAGSPRVSLYGGDPSTLSRFSFREAPVRASLPGYSSDGRLALVMLSIPWSVHGCDGKYVLIKEDHVWQVRVREFVCYL